MMRVIPKVIKDSLNLQFHWKQIIHLGYLIIVMNNQNFSHFKTLNF